MQRLSPTTARAFWEQSSTVRADAPAVRSGNTLWSYGEFDAWVNQLANGLADHGVRAGSTVAILLPTSARLLRMQVALCKLGAISVPMICGSTAREASFVLEHSGAEFLITDGPGWASTREAAGAGVGVFLEDCPADADARELAVLESGDDTAPPDPGIDPMAPMSIMYTSGSTGRPKGVVQPTCSLATTGRALVDAMSLAEEDNILCVLPLFHTAASHMAFGSAVAAGACLTLADRFSRENFWPLARRSHATASYLFPAQIAILLSSRPTPEDREHDLRVCFSHSRNQPFCERFNVDVRPGWAMTETCGMGTLTRAPEPQAVPGRVGTPYPPGAEVRIVDEHENELPPGSQGEIQFRHPHVMIGYHRDPEQTTRTLRDGWVASGDLGSRDEEGVLRFHGRIKNMIKRAGENISGEEVEAVLMSHPAVEEALVFAVPDPIRTEEVYAAVCIRGGHEVAAAALHEWCSTRLSGWKVPRYLALAGEPFPRLPNGKTDRGAVAGAAQTATAWQPQGTARRSTGSDGRP